MIKIELNDREVRQVLDRLARRVNNLTPALHDVGQALMEGSRQRISEGRDWQGRPFAPNSPFTLARKRGTKPLVDTGNLVGSVFPACAGMNRRGKAGEAGKARKGLLISQQSTGWQACLNRSSLMPTITLGRAGCWWDCCLRRPY